MPRRTAVAEISDWREWSVVIDPHRCSRSGCRQPAVAVLNQPYFRLRQPTRNRRRWFCTDHLAELNRYVCNDKVWWLLTLWPDHPLTDLSVPWPYPRVRSDA